MAEEKYQRTKQQIAQSITIADKAKNTSELVSQKVEVLIANTVELMAEIQSMQASLTQVVKQQTSQIENQNENQKQDNQNHLALTEMLAKFREDFDSHSNKLSERQNLAPKRANQNSGRLKKLMINTNKNPNVKKPLGKHSKRPSRVVRRNSRSGI